ncbi:hypothetical protein CC80DRAFT_189254 [Byssothecium circinans]|uniref:Uncharacterized protein n=1 Tax=Byssothecium circinans TaxID=147558 RepID=A0A6A5TM81_9PLEO|nr:hypothetical protein CC80DRAFT_189254 [Byssothecium circinans]
MQNHQQLKKLPLPETSSHSRSRNNAPSTSSTAPKPAPLQSFMYKIRPRSSSTAGSQSPSQSRLSSTSSHKSRDTSKSQVVSTSSQRSQSQSQLLIKSRHTSTSSILSLNKALPPLPPTPISPLPVQPTFEPVHSDKSRQSYAAPNLGESGWGQRDWKKVKAEREWLQEQKGQYAGQERIYKEMAEKSVGRGEGRVVSGEEKWEMEMKRVSGSFPSGWGNDRKMASQNSRGGEKNPFATPEKEKRAREEREREMRHRRRGEMLPKESVSYGKREDRLRERRLEKQLELHPPTPRPWPGQDDSDSDWILSPLATATDFLR